MIKKYVLLIFWISTWKGNVRLNQFILIIKSFFYFSLPQSFVTSSQLFKYLGGIGTPFVSDVHYTSEIHQRPFTKISW